MAMMEQKQSSLPLLSAKYPWFVTQHLGADEDSSRDQYFYTLHDPLAKYQCQIPELVGRRIRGYYHGWVILSDHLQNVMWSLWNPLTSKMIRFPKLDLRDGDSESIRECCLSAPPNHPSSVFLLTRTNKPTFVFLCLKGKRQRLKWTEMSYASQLKRITGEDADFIDSLTCCNGKVYGFNGTCSFASFMIQVDIMVEDKKQVLITLALFGILPCPPLNEVCNWVTYLKGHCGDLFCINVGLSHVGLSHVGLSQKEIKAVYLYKLDMTSVESKDMEKFKGLDMSCESWFNLDDLTDIMGTLELWERLSDLKDAVFFVDLGRNYLSSYRPGIASELGGYIHIRDKLDDILYSYHVKENTISRSFMPPVVLPTSNLSLWEYCLEDDHGGAKCSLEIEKEVNQIMVTQNEFGLDEWNLLNLPHHLVELILQHCLCVEYLKFRATCKLCQVAAPLIQWSKETALMRSQNYSLVSPWLMVLDENQGFLTFTDPMLGDSYFMKNQHVSLAYHVIYCSRFGWLLFFSSELKCLVLVNPFTSDLRKLPEASYSIYSACFSAPPTSPDCMVAGFSIDDEFLVLIHYLARESSWRTVRVSGEPGSLCFPTFFGKDVYALDGDGSLIRFEELVEEDDLSLFVESRAPASGCTSRARYYLMKCDKDLLRVMVGKSGEPVEVLKWDVSKKEWEKRESLGNHIIFICNTTCLCIEAKTREMENKICFPRLHSKSRKMVFYSLETCTYQTYNGENIQQKDLFGSRYHLSPHVWIEPSWA